MTLAKIKELRVNHLLQVFGRLLDVMRANKENKVTEYFNELAQKHRYYFLRFVLLQAELLTVAFACLKVSNIFHIK